MNTKSYIPKLYLSEQIKQRECVAWNEKLGSHGAWDADLCTTVLTVQTETVCECYIFSTFSIIAEYVEKPVLPDELLWISAIKYIGFTLSIMLLLFLAGIIVVNL